MYCDERCTVVADGVQMQLVFHNDDHSSHTLTVDSLTTVAQVCDQLVQCNHAVHSPHWTIVERLGRYQLGAFTHRSLVNLIPRPSTRPEIPEI